MNMNVTVNRTTMMGDIDHALHHLSTDNVISIASGTVKVPVSKILSGVSKYLLGMIAYFAVTEGHTYAQVANALSCDKETVLFGYHYWQSANTTSKRFLNIERNIQHYKESIEVLRKERIRHIYKSF